MQLDTYGSQDKKMKGKADQFIQFDEAGAAELKRLIESTFHRLE